MNLKYIYLFTIRRLYLFFYVLKKHFVRTFFSSLGLLISMVLIFSILGILRPVKKVIMDQFEQNLSVDTLIIKASSKAPKTSSLIGLFRTKKDFKLGLDETLLRKIKTWDEVKTTGVTQILQRPVNGQFDHPVLSKMGITFDMIIQGVSSNLVYRNLKCMNDFKTRKDLNSNGDLITQVPLVLPESFAEMAYAYSVMNGLPPITKKEMIGLKINLLIGSAPGRSVENALNGFTGVVCGFVPQNIVSVAGAPLSWVSRIHKYYDLKNASRSYDKIFIEIKDIRMMDSITRKLSAYPVEILSGANNTINKITKWLNNLDILLWSFVAILLLISAISLANSFMILTAQKQFEFGLYLVFGASPLFLWFLIFLEGAFWGAFNSSLAFFIAQNFSDALQKVLQLVPWINELNKESLTFQFSMSLSEESTLIIGSIFFSGLSSLLPAMYMTGRKTLSLIKKD